MKILLILILGAPELGPVGTIELEYIGSFHDCELVAQSYRTDLDEMHAYCEVSHD